MADSLLLACFVEARKQVFCWNLSFVDGLVFRKPIL
jgi:hypothetical protein